MDPLPLTAKALLDNSVVTSSARVLEYFRSLKQHTERQFIQKARKNQARENQRESSYPDPCTFPEYNNDNGNELTTNAFQADIYDIYSGDSIHGTSFISYSQDGSYTNIIDHQSHPAHPARSAYSGSDRDHLERPGIDTDAVSVSHTSGSDSVQTSQVSETLVTKRFREIASRPAGQQHDGLKEQDEPEDRKEKRRRKNPQSEQERISAKKLKDFGGGCRRCKRYNERCDRYVKGICNACERDPKRDVMTAIWVFPCVASFKEIAYRFISRSLADNLAEKKIRDFFHEIAIDVHGTWFYILFNIGFADDIGYEGREYIPKGDELSCSKRAISKDMAPTVVRTDYTLPVCIEPNLKDQTAKIQRWLEDALNPANLSRYPEYCFPHNEFRWVAEVLAAVCRFYQESRVPREERGRPDNKLKVKNEETLTWALELSIMTSFMESSIHIPPHAVPSVERNLKEYSPPNGQLPDTPDLLPKGSIVAPRIVNKVMKSGAFHLYGQLPGKLLQGLTELLNSAQPQSWGSTFCIMILLLTAVEGSQQPLVDKYLFASEDDPEKVTKFQIERLFDLEYHFADFPITNFMGKYSGYNPIREKSAKQELDPATKTLVDTIRKIFLQDYPDAFQLRGLELRTPNDAKTFANSNPARLLTKFLAPLFGSSRD